MIYVTKKQVIRIVYKFVTRGVNGPEKHNPKSILAENNLWDNRGQIYEAKVFFLEKNGLDFLCHLKGLPSFVEYPEKKRYSFETCGSGALKLWLNNFK